MSLLALNHFFGIVPKGPFLQTAVMFFYNGSKKFKFGWDEQQLSTDFLQAFFPACLTFNKSSLRTSASSTPLYKLIQSVSLQGKMKRSSNTMVTFSTTSMSFFIHADASSLWIDYMGFMDKINVLSISVCTFLSENTHCWVAATLTLKPLFFNLCL